MKPKLVTNPFIVYVLAFLAMVMLYPLHWSALYPELSLILLAFIAGTIIINLFIGLLFHKTGYLSYSNINFSRRKLWFWSVAIFVSYLIEFAYMGVIPLYAISTGQDYLYTSFGIPTFHVVVVTFNSFWAVFVFHNLVSQKTKSLIIPFILCLIPSILIFNRGMFLIIIGSCLFVKLMSSRKPLRLVLKIVLLLQVLLFVFGVAGNVRLAGEVSANDVILKLGRATDKFIESSIPNEFFWAYLYMTSPMGNLQETIDRHQISRPDPQKVAVFVNSEILPDFISKRNKQLFKQIEPIDQISESFTVGTVYARSYAYFGTWGMITIFLYVLLFNIVVIFSLVKNSAYFVSGIAVLSCLMFFNTFDNMYTFAGGVLQLVYPILLGIASRFRLGGRKLESAIIST